MDYYFGKLNHTCQPPNTLHCEQLVRPLGSIQDQRYNAQRNVILVVEHMFDHKAGEPHPLLIQNTNILSDTNDNNTNKN